MTIDCVGHSLWKQSWLFASPVHKPARRLRTERSTQPTASPAHASSERLMNAQSNISKRFLEFRVMIAFTLFKTDWLPDAAYIKPNYAKD